MKRPLTVLAVGFVLGEVLALQNHEVVFPVCLGWLCAAAGALGIWNCGIRGWSPDGKMQGRGAGKKALLLFLALAVLGGSAGAWRGKWERNRLDREEASAGGFEEIRPTLEGRIETLEQGNDSYSMVLGNVTARAGNRQESFGRVMVYMKEGEEGGGDTGKGEKGKFSGKTASGRTSAGRTATGKKVSGETVSGKKASGRKASGKQASLGTLRPGMLVELRGRLEAVEDPGNPGVFDYRSYYRSKGIACRIFGDSMEVKEEQAVPYSTFLMEFRLKCAQILDAVCRPEDSSVMKAVLLGDTSGMEPEVRAMYQRHGISHLLAVSGQHLAIIGGSIYLLMRRLGLGYGKSGALSGILVISYGIMAGCPGSAMRAIIMILCLWLAARAGRSYDTLSALGLAALILLWKSPYLLFQSGFQLSFGAVLSIGGLGSWLQHGFGVRTPWQKTILISLCVQIVITPVVLFHYFQHPLYGIFLNLLVIPLMAVLMYSGLLGIIIGSFWLNGGVAAVGAGHYVLCIYGWLCRQVERFPGYCLVLGRPSWFSMWMYLAGMAGGLYGLVRWNRRVKRKSGNTGLVRKTGIMGKSGMEGNGRPGPPWFFLGMSACLYGLCFLLLFPRPVKGLEVIVMDVGQGDGILMRTGRFTVLVDGGSSSDKNLGSKTLEPCLKSLGITTIDFALVSHGDSDHISGLLYLMEESKDIKVRNLFLPAQGKGQDVYERLEQAARFKGGLVRYMEPGEQIRAGNLGLTCLYGGDGSFQTEDRNAHSLVVCADYGGFHMLFTGDMGMEQEEELMELALTEGSLQQEHLDHVQVLKTAHHGSETSSGADFLDRLGLGLAIISYGKGNSYGHPSPQVVERMKSRHIPVMETGTGGAVLLWTDGNKLFCRYFKEE